MSSMPTARTVGRLRKCLEDRLARAEKRLTVLGRELLSASMIEGSVAHRELVREQYDLREIVAATRKALVAVTHHDDKEEIERHEKTVTLMLREKDAQLARSQDNWLRQGEHRTARLYRMQSLDFRFTVEHELGTPGLPVP